MGIGKGDSGLLKDGVAADGSQVDGQALDAQIEARDNSMGEIKQEAILGDQKRDWPGYRGFDRHAAACKFAAGCNSIDPFEAGLRIFAGLVRGGAAGTGWTGQVAEYSALPALPARALNCPRSFRGHDSGAKAFELVAGMTRGVCSCGLGRCGERRDASDGVFMAPGKRLSRACGRLW